MHTMRATTSFILLTAALLTSCSCSRSDDGASAASNASTFAVTFQPSGQYAIGKEGAALVRLTPQGGYKVNTEYPIRFDCQSPPSDGITYPKPTLQQTDAKVDESEATFSVPFVPTKAGKQRVEGLLSFSVCNDQRCVMDKQKVTLDVTVP